jgi:hypothetical protein
MSKRYFNHILIIQGPNPNMTAIFIEWQFRVKYTVKLKDTEDERDQIIKEKDEKIDELNKEIRKMEKDGHWPFITFRPRLLDQNQLGPLGGN